MQSRLLIKTDYRGNPAYYFPIPDIARQAGFGPYLDFIGPYSTEADARQDEQRTIQKASQILLHCQSKSATPADKTKQKKLRQAGYEARETGVNIDACPYPYTAPTGYYWLLGWWRCEREINSPPSAEILNSPRKNIRRRRADHGPDQRRKAVTDTAGKGIKTKLYFSFDPALDVDDVQILREAGVDRLLVTYPSPTEGANWSGVHKILCSKTSPSSPDFDLETYLEFVEIAQDEMDFALSCEAHGDSEATRMLWLQTTEWLAVNLGDMPVEDWPTILPVWGWGSSLDLLDRYLHESHLVAIGGNLPYLLKGQDRGVLQDLVALCHQYKGRLHIHRCDWTAAIEQLLGLAYSIDTEVWKDGRQGANISHDIKTGLLHMAPATVTPGCKELSGYALCVRNARNLKDFADNPCNLVVSMSQCDVCGGTFNSKGNNRKYCTPGCAAIYNKSLK